MIGKKLYGREIEDPLCKASKYMRVDLNMQKTDINCHYYDVRHNGYLVAEHLPASMGQGV